MAGGWLGGVAGVVEVHQRFHRLPRASVIRAAHLAEASVGFKQLCLGLGEPLQGRQCAPVLTQRSKADPVHRRKIRSCAANRFGTECFGLLQLSELAL